MALMERFFDVCHTGHNFFDRYFQNAMLEMQAMETEMSRMRNQMYQLMPHNPEGGTLDTDMQPRVPIVEEHGETKLKLQFNVKDFAPEEVKVKILGNKILQVFTKWLAVIVIVESDRFAVLFRLVLTLCIMT